ncbi:MAG: DUF2652 domain-containing protein [Hymenobacteraceae bacterium]|nr:DUF2652 domain-containing protein [Hymenobacteraceae bacterium]MDX5397727.1 DUF2652 domain-containing protein [Hymenobacteraceae bacterium]MDX5444375.1 DUF2652 domain-containing protein [Hymenobacteraceae bacterium]MDX5513805.1 DUF2652 domain-containing protein [Hymenobacteraceae bacterium]
MELKERKYIVEAQEGSAADDELDDTQPALIFIPDISGFTKFVNDAGIKQSRNLIANLLETIIEANILDMKVCEIQGDAILFYKLGTPPSISDIVDQCKQFYLDFQNYLHAVERDTGSKLSHALVESRLTLKTIVHYGNISVTQIKDYTKLMGKDVIVAHRLLKNNIEGNEYVLLTENYLKTQDEEEIKRNFEWTQLRNGHITYEYLGEIKYKYAFLTPLRLLVTNLDPLREKHAYQNSFTVREQIQAPVDFVLRIVRNFRLKPKWVVGMRNMEFDVSKGDRIGSYYKCRLDSSHIELQVVQQFVRENYVEYVEKISNYKRFPNVLLFYYMKETEPGITDVTIEFHYSRVRAAGYLHDFFARKRMRRLLCKSVIRLKDVCEALYSNRKKQLVK